MTWIRNGIIYYCRYNLVLTEPNSKKIWCSFINQSFQHAFPAPEHSRTAYEHSDSRDTHCTLVPIGYNWCTRVTRHKKNCETRYGASNWKKLWRGVGCAGNWLWRAKIFPQTVQRLQMWWQRVMAKRLAIKKFMPTFSPYLSLSLSFLSHFLFSVFLSYNSASDLSWSKEHIAEKNVPKAGIEPPSFRWLMST